MKYEPSHAFGVVYSGTSNLVWAPSNASQGAEAGSGIAYAGANEVVISWGVKKGQELGRWRDPNCTAEVTALCKSPTDEDVFAVGYGDGSIRVWDSRTETPMITFNGHKSMVTVLTFDRSGARIASGSRDTNIILWDLLGEVGLFRLRGHKDQITGLEFLYPAVDGAEEESSDEASAVLSTSKDSLIKVWDISSQHCIETHVAQTNGECWAMSVSPDQSGCITAGNEGEMRVWNIDLQVLQSLLTGVTSTTDLRVLQDLGTLYRHGKDKPLGVYFHPRSDYISVYGSEKASAVEIFRIRSGAEVKAAMARKRRRRREKAAATNGADNADGMDVDDVSEERPEISEVFVSYGLVRPGGRIRAFSWIKNKDRKKLSFLVGTANNMVEHYTVEAKDTSKKAKSEGPPDYDRVATVELPAHRDDIRALALSSDDRMLATGSHGSLKIWNLRTRNCVRTLEWDKGQALCCAFLPGDKIALVGDRQGQLHLFDIASSTLLETIQAHDGDRSAIWTLDVHPDGRSVATGGEDKQVKFWDFQVAEERVPGTNQTTPRFKLVQKRIMKVADDVLKVCFSPDSRLIAVATMDTTVKVFFVDSLKLFLNLYGHKLPVLDISISNDSKLISTCSADKNIRLWGLDFGDCHKAFFGHQDSITQVAFIPHPISRDDAHLFFSASRDRTLKTWDGDKFEQIQKLDGHHGDIWAMVVSRTGDFVVTAAHDKSIRIWNQSDEPIFLEEEREKEMEQLYESTLQASLEDDMALDGEGGQADDKVESASKQTIQTLTAGERIAEALELGTTDLAVVSDWNEKRASNPTMAAQPPDRNPLFLALGNISAERHVLNTIAKIPAPQLHDALLVLPFSMLPQLFTFISIWLKKGWNVNLVCRVLFFMLATHQRQIVSSGELRVVLEEMRDNLYDTLGNVKDTYGFNLAALKFIEGKVKEDEAVSLEDAMDNVVEKRGQKKRTFVEIA